MAHLQVTDYNYGSKFKKMNILLIGRTYTESFAIHIAETLQNMNHIVMVYEPDIPVSITKNKLHFRWTQAKTQVNNIYRQTGIGIRNKRKKLLAFTENFKVDILISCHDFLTPIDLAALKQKHKCTTILWFPDAISNFGKAMFLDANYDYLFFKEPFVVNILTNEFNKNAFYLPECCNPLLHNKVPISAEDKEKYGCDITTAGNMHTARAALFKQLSNYSIKIWGNPAPIWMDTNGLASMIQNCFVSNTEKCKAFLCSQIVLNTMYPTEVTGVNVRTFEIAATGAFQLVNYRASLHQLYEEGKEIVSFKTIGELREKIDYYLMNEKERTIIAQRAYERTHRDHTYEKRLQLLLDTVSGKATGFPIPSVRLEIG
jgi:spore maturation protein CgeB